MHLLEWQYLIFLMPLALGVLYLLMLSAGLSLGGGDVDVEADVDADIDAHVDVDADVDHPEVAHAELGPLAAMASILGLGRVPLSIILLSYCFVWGVGGLMGITAFGLERMPMVITVAAVAAVVLTRILAGVVGRLIPSVASYHTPMKDLVGNRGRVLHTVTTSSGTVRLTDDRGTLRDVPCRILEGTPELPPDAVVVLVNFDREQGWFLAAALPSR
jgi:membrane protein implicated in regulation of membrane protease activity